MCVPRKNNREKWDKSQRLRIKKHFVTRMKRVRYYFFYENKSLYKNLGLERYIRH